MATESSMERDQVLLETRGSCALATINRPKVLNVMSKNMILTLRSSFGSWDQPNNGISCIVLRGAGEKAFCAGADLITQIRENGANGPKVAYEFYKIEYRLCYQISTIKKPYVAIIDGYTMGFGCGLSINGMFRVATERSVVAMPECGIGLFPDVGASRFFADLQPGLGKYLGITGARLKGQDVKVAGLATHYIPSQRLPQLLESLSKIDARTSDKTTVNGVLKSFEDPPNWEEINRIQEKLNCISNCFTHEKLEDIKQSLETQTGEYSKICKEALELIMRGSPISICIHLEQLKRTRDLDLMHCLEMELRIAKYFTLGKTDFREGIRARLVDRDGEPDWKYKSVDEVPSSLMEECFNFPVDKSLFEDGMIRQEDTSDNHDQ